MAQRYCFLTNKKIGYILFFLCSSKERTKERAPEMTNLAFMSPRYTYSYRSTIKAKFHTISGLPPLKQDLQLRKVINDVVYIEFSRRLDFKFATRSFLDKD
jgi:hypothetical protein